MGFYSLNPQPMEAAVGNVSKMYENGTFILMKTHYSPMMNSYLEVSQVTGELLQIWCNSCLMMTSILVGGLEHLDYFSHHIGNVIIPTDELHHFSEG